MYYKYLPLDLYARFNAKGVVTPIAIINSDGSTERMEIHHMRREQQPGVGWATFYTVYYGNKQRIIVRQGDKWFEQIEKGGWQAPGRS